MSSLHAVQQADHRNEVRLPAELQAVVQIKQGPNETYKEITNVTTVSRNGAGFSLSQRCEVGRLLTIVLPMPEDLRVYDHKQELYPVLGIVQYCNEGMVGKTKVFHTGVGFIGKRVPDSFKADPTQNYRVIGMSRDGLWEIVESGTTFQNRKQPRYWLSLGVTLSLIQKEARSITREETFTRNVGAGGVSVTSSLNANVGDKVKFACKSLDFYAIGVVRNRNTVDGRSATLHIQFADDEFPVDKAIRLHAAA